jgi:UPF0042 nucleotide-binding protein
LEIIIITGLSGAGKSIAIKSLEDMGFFCIDNLPVNLLAKMVELSSLSESKLDRVGVVIDVRGRTFFKELETELRYLETGGIPHRIIFLEASDGALIRRYKESRRIHPLSVEKGIAESINEERKLLQAIKKRADLVIDTSDISMNQLRSNLRKYLSETAAGEDFQLVLISFGYKYGIPLDADIVFDVRFLPNPFWVAELKDLDGFDPQVAEYVLGKREAVRFVRDFEKMLKFLMPLYVKEGKSFLTLAIGCTGGRHRSVAISEVLAGYMRELSFDVHVRHRDVERG